MKKIKAILVLSAILFLCAFVFAACGPKESGYVGMLGLFRQGNFQSRQSRRQQGFGQLSEKKRRNKKRQIRGLSQSG